MWGRGFNKHNQIITAISALVFLQTIDLTLFASNLLEQRLNVGINTRLFFDLRFSQPFGNSGSGAPPKRFDLLTYDLRLSYSLGSLHAIEEVISFPRYTLHELISRK